MAAFYILTGRKLWAGKEGKTMKAQSVLWEEVVGGGGEARAVKKDYIQKELHMLTILSQTIPECKEAVLLYHQQPIWKFPHKPTSCCYVFPAY